MLVCHSGVIIESLNVRWTFWTIWQYGISIHINITPLSDIRKECWWKHKPTWHQPSNWTVSNETLSFFLPSSDRLQPHGQCCLESRPLTAPWIPISQIWSQCFHLLPETKWNTMDHIVRVSFVNYHSNINLSHLILQYTIKRSITVYHCYEKWTQSTWQSIYLACGAYCLLNHISPARCSSLTFCEQSGPIKQENKSSVLREWTTDGVVIPLKDTNWL